MPIEIAPVTNKRDREEFLRLPHRIYRDDPNWVPPLYFERREFLDPKKNPFFTHGEAQLFLARRDGETVGRISAQVNREHNRVHNDKVGFFGFFEAIDDVDVARALVGRADAWLRERGCDRARGPMSFTINDEIGVLVEGFDSPPFILMAHSPRYYNTLLEGCGLAKVKDLYAWRYESARPVPKEIAEIADEVRKAPGLVIREADKKNLDKDLRVILEIFNEVWRANWGFVPMTGAELAKAAKEFKMILEPKLALIAEVNGQPVAISIAIPNIHEAIKDLRGRLFPFGILKLLWRVKVAKTIRSTRLMLLGIRRAYRGHALGSKGLSVLLYTEMHLRSRKLGHWGGELGWTLEDNDKINIGIEMMGGQIYKRYRIFEKAL